MPAKSKRQRRLMAMALQYKKGDRGVIKELTPEGKSQVIRLAGQMGARQLREYAVTKEKRLPLKKKRKKRK